MCLFLLLLFCSLVFLFIINVEKEAVVLHICILSDVGIAVFTNVNCMFMSQEP